MAITGIGLPDLQIKVGYFGSRRFEALRHGWRPLSPMWVLHWHETSTATIRWNGQSWRLGPECATLVAPRTATYQTLEAGEEQTYIHFLVGAEGLQIEDRLYVLGVDPIMRELLEVVTKAFRTRHKIDPLERFDVYSLLCRAMRQTSLSEWPESAVDPRIRAALDILDRRFSEPLCNADLADVAGLATNSFVRLFKRQVGTSPGAYLRSQRLNAAAMRLAYRHETIEQIAERCGFCDRNYFSTAFRRIFGMGPAAYRRQVRS